MTDYILDLNIKENNLSKEQFCRIDFWLNYRNISLVRCVVHPSTDVEEGGN